MYHFFDPLNQTFFHLEESYPIITYYNSSKVWLLLSGQSPFNNHLYFFISSEDTHITPTLIALFYFENHCTLQLKYFSHQNYLQVVYNDFFTLKYYLFLNLFKKMNH